MKPISLNSFSLAYHGTMKIYQEEIMDFINLSKGRSRTDFGKGFYVTNNKSQAMRWAKQKCMDSKIDTTPILATLHILRNWLY